MTSSSYHISTHNQNLESELKRLRLQQELTWQKESRLLQWFGLEDGMTILELGCGPGLTTEMLLRLLPNCSVTAIDADPVALDLAQQHLEAQGLMSRVNLVRASTDDTSLASSSYDFAMARLLFQHLSDPSPTVQEVFRLLKPGGGFSVTDTDGELFWLIDPPLLDLNAISRKLSHAQKLQGGNRLVGRHLWRLLKVGGFEELSLESIIASSDELGLEKFLYQIDPNLLLDLVNLGMMTSEEWEEICSLREQFLQSPDPIILMQWLICYGQKKQV